MSPDQKTIETFIETMRRARSAGDLRAGFEDTIRQFSQTSGWPLSFAPCSEGTLVTASRTSTLFASLFITYEKPGTLLPDPGHPDHPGMVDRLRQRLPDTGPEERRHEAALCTDGRYLLLYLPWQDDPHCIPRPLTSETARTIFWLIQALHRKVLSLEELERDLGAGQPLAREAIRTLLAVLTDKPGPRPETMFQEWCRLMGIVSGEEFLKAREKARALSKLFGVEKKTDLAHLLFCIHTFHALLARLLAIELLCSVKGEPSLCRELAELDPAPLHKKMADVQDGRLFSALGVKNMLAGDLFSWYLAVWDDGLAATIRNLARILGQYEPVTAILCPEKTARLLKDFYAGFVSQKVRRDGGETFTPEWLAERLLNHAGYDGNPDKRILDPACGWGTVLAECLRRVQSFRADHADRYPDPSAVLDKILTNVAGMDLHPLAVVISRTTYLMGLGTLLGGMRAEIQIPVTLSDAVLGPREQVELFHRGFVWNTSAGDFVIPSGIVNNGHVASLGTVLEDCLRLQCGVETFLEQVQQACRLDQEALESAQTSLVDLYQTLLDLDRQGRNRLWAGMLQDAFAASLPGEFDCIVSDPPRLNWKQLPPDYRNAARPLWEEYERLAKSCHMEYEAGRQHRDMATLFTCEQVKTHLKNKGKMAVVASRAVLKVHQHDLFRTFRTEKDRPVRAVHVDDLTELRPIEEAREGTVIIVLQGGAETQYPVPYTLWTMKKGGKILPPASLDEVSGVSLRSNLHARPIEKDRAASPWITARASTLDILEKIIGPSAYQAKTGIRPGADAYLVRFLTEGSGGLWVIENVPAPARRKARLVQMPVEPDLLFPALTAADLSRWHCRTEHCFIFPYRNDPDCQEIPADEMKAEFPRTYAYLAEFREVLAGRTGYETFLRERPFYALEDAAPEFRAGFKVVWTVTGAGISASVVGPQEKSRLKTSAAIPLHPLAMVACEKAEEAYYLSAVCNSSLVNITMKTSAPPSPGNPEAPLMLRYAAIPRFQASDSSHRELAELALQAHRLAALRLEGPASAPARGKEGHFLHGIEEQIDNKVAQLWDISPDELMELKRSLKELG